MTHAKQSISYQKHKNINFFHCDCSKWTKGQITLLFCKSIQGYHTSFFAVHRENIFSAQYLRKQYNRWFFCCFICTLLCTRNMQSGKVIDQKLLFCDYLFVMISSFGSYLIAFKSKKRTKEDHMPVIFLMLSSIRTSNAVGFCWMAPVP